MVLTKISPSFHLPTMHFRHPPYCFQNFFSLLPRHLIAFTTMMIICPFFFILSFYLNLLLYLKLKQHLIEIPPHTQTFLGECLRLSFISLNKKQ